MAIESKSDVTKYESASAIKECLKTTPVDEIPIMHITSVATWRRLFTGYNNYDLIDWYFDKLLLESFKNIGKRNNIHSGIIKKFTCIEKEKVFFSTGVQSKDRNFLKDHDFQLILEFYLDLLKKGKVNIDQETEFLLEMYCRGSIDMTVNWVVKGHNIDPIQFAKLLVDAMPVRLSEIFDFIQLLK